MGSEPIETSRVSNPSSAGKLFPPGFRFHPTDEELVLYYLKRKICRRSVKPDLIAEVDVYKWDPEELPGKSKLKTGDRQWFFFSPRDRKYPNGRSSRATMNGYWKATGKDRAINRKSSPVGNKKTLVYYQGRAPSGLRTDWVMHEYTMYEEELKRCPGVQDHYVLYKIFKKSGPGPKNGEQYGAPFIEEEWNDEDCLDVDSLLVEKVNPFSVNVLENSNARQAEAEDKEDEAGLPREISEFLDKVIEDPDILPPLPEYFNSSPVFCIQSVSNEVEKDFLEMDDLVGPEPRDCDSVTDFDSFSGLDSYYEQVEFQGAYTDNLEYGPENSGFTNEVASYDLWNHHDHGYSSAYSSVLTSQTVHEPVSNPSSGVITEENPGKPEYHVNQCPENVENTSESWLSSALWAFVDSIPTTPASASESSALVNRAFERMSSFTRGSNVNSTATTTADCGAASGSEIQRLAKPKPKRSNKNLLYFSVLGVLFAVLWVFIIGSCSIELSSRFVWW